MELTKVKYIKIIYGVSFFITFVPLSLLWISGLIFASVGLGALFSNHGNLQALLPTLVMWAFIIISGVSLYTFSSISGLAIIQTKRLKELRFWEHISIAFGVLVTVIFAIETQAWYFYIPTVTVALLYITLYLHQKSHFKQTTPTSQNHPPQEPV